MDNVLNRPLFRHREARDRLNDIAGVQRFQEGGEVIQRFTPGDPVSFDLTGAIRRPSRSEVSSVGPRPSVRPEGLPSLTEAFNTGIPMSPGMIFDNLVVRAGSTMNDPGTVMQALNEKLTDPNLRPNERRALESQRSALNFAIEAGYGATDAVTDALSVLQSVGSGVMEYGVAPVVSAASPELGEMIYDQIPMFDATAEELALMGQAVPSNLRPSDTPKTVAFEAAGRGTPPSPESVGLPQRRTGPGAPGDRQGPMAYSSPEEVAAVAEAATGPSTMEADARGRGPLITDPAAVAAGLNAEDPAIREKTTAEFMKEYTDAAPKYEGMDKGLLLAQIGFAIAAGESPNAMQNIANGLLAGSDMMLKDKAAKDEFGRQVQLAAMQYGFGEAARERELGRQFTDYVASQEVTYRGKKYGPNESIPVLHSDIINGRMPDGVVSESMNDAMLATDASIRKSLIEAQKDGRLAPEQYRQALTELDKAASDFSKARNTIPLIEASIIRNAEGQVTGLNAGLMKAINQAATFVGINLGKEYESPEAYQSAMQTVAARMVQNILGESGANISNVDRELVAAIVGVAAGGYGNAFKDPQVLNAKLQEILQQAEGQQQSALDTYNTLMEGFGSTYSPSGTPVRSLRAERVFAPEQPVQAFEYTIDENGRYVKRYLDGEK